VPQKQELSVHRNWLHDYKRVTPTEMLDILPRKGWHVEIIACGGTLAAVAPIIAKAEFHVIDHYACRK